MTLSNLTVIIPSYDRQEFLLKQFIHWSDTHAKLIIVDGSIKPIAKNIQELFKQNGNTTYIHLEESVGNRLLVASKLITTPYTVTSNDDDFLIKSGVISSVEYLERNSKVVACRGQSIRAYILNNKKTIKYTGIFNRYSDYEANQQQAIQRLQYAFSRYNGATLFAVLRTDIWKKSWVKGYTKKYSSTNVSEFFQNIVVYIFGGVVCLPVPYSIITGAFPIVNNPTDNRNLLFSTWAKDSEYKNEKIGFINDLANLLFKNSVLGTKDSRKLIEEIIESYVVNLNKYSLASTLFGFQVSEAKIEKFKSIFFNKNLLKIYFLFKTLVINYITKSKSVPLYRLTDSKNRSKVSLNQEQSNEIKSFEKIILISS
jgi:glycosyltransferase domain-containing protein